MVNIQLLEDCIKDSGKTKTFLSEKIGMTIQSFRLKCTNKSEFTLSEADALCSELGITNLIRKEEIFFAKNVDMMPTKAGE